MAQVLQFPSNIIMGGRNLTAENRARIEAKNSNVNNNLNHERNYFEKIQRINVLNHAAFNDSGLTKQIGSENIEKRGGAIRVKNEDDYISGYLIYINMEIKIKSKNSFNNLDILKKLEGYLSGIMSIRRDLKTGITEVQSLRIGELKRAFRSLMVYYIKAKEGLIELENNTRKTMAA